MADESTAVATATPATAENSGFSLDQFRQQHGAPLVERYKGNQTRKKQLRQESERRHEFCEERGINLEVSVQHFLDTANAENQPHQNAAPPIEAKAEWSKEVNFVVKVATERPQEGFTMEELPGIAEKAGFGDMSTKEARQPLLAAVLAAQKEGVLKVSEAKRDGKTVYVAAGQQA